MNKEKQKNKKMKIKISSLIPTKFFLRQLPEQKSIWGDYEFFINQEVEECDYWFVYEGIKDIEKTKCPKSNIVLITGEPPTVKTYNEKFIQQFGHVITCHQDIIHKRKILFQQGLLWRVGIKFIPGNDVLVEKNYHDLNCEFSDKSKLLSIVCSNKIITDGHKKRYEFVKKLKNYFGDKIDIFGQGFSPIPDKLNALSKYKYHVAIENCSIPDYWTEKLADPFITETYPFYYGCCNIDKYFPEGAYSFIDIFDANKSIKIIENAIKNNVFEESRSKIKEAKKLVIEKYNIFNIIAEFSHNNVIKNNYLKKIIIKPEEYFEVMQKKKFFRKIEMQLTDIFRNFI